MKDCRYGHDYQPNGICRNCLRRRIDPDTRAATPPPAPLQHEWETGQLDLPDDATTIGGASDYTAYPPDSDPDPSPVSDPAPDFGGGDTGGGGASGDF